MQGSAPHPRRNLWLRSSDFVPGRTRYGGEGWDLPGPASGGCRGNADAPPSQRCSRKDALVGNDQVKISVTPGGTRPVPAPWPCCGRETGALLGAAHGAGQLSRGMGGGEVSAPCSPSHSFPAAPLVCRLPQQHPKPSTCIQRALRSPQREGCETGSCAASCLQTEAKPHEAQGRRALEGLLRGTRL